MPQGRARRRKCHGMGQAGPERQLIAKRRSRQRAERKHRGSRHPRAVIPGPAPRKRRTSTRGRNQRPECRSRKPIRHGADRPHSDSPEPKRVADVEQKRRRIDGKPTQMRQVPHAFRSHRDDRPALKQERTIRHQPGATAKRQCNQAAAHPSATQQHEDPQKRPHRQPRIRLGPKRTHQRHGRPRIPLSPRSAGRPVGEPPREQPQRRLLEPSGIIDVTQLDRRDPTRPARETAQP